MGGKTKSLHIFEEMFTPRSYYKKHCIKRTDVLNNSI